MGRSSAMAGGDARVAESRHREKVEGSDIAGLSVAWSWLANVLRRAKHRTENLPCEDQGVAYPV